MSLFATLSATVLTGAATPVSITAYQDANPYPPYNTRPWLSRTSPVAGIMAGASVSTEPGTAVSRARGMLYTQLVIPARIVRVRVQVGPVERVVKSTVVDGYGSTPTASWPDTTAWVGVCALPGDPPSEPSAMRMAAWTGEGADESGWVVETYYDERTRSDYVRVRGNLGLVVVSKKLGCRITGIKTSPP